MFRQAKTSDAWPRTTGEHSPVALRRMLALLQSPVLASAQISELTLLAENVVESTFVKGEHLAPPGQRVASVHYVLEGRVEMAAPAPVAWTAHSTFGLLEVLCGRALPGSATAVTDVTTLELDGADLFELVEEHFGLLHLLLRSLAARVIELPSRWPLVPEPAPHPVGPLGLVDRMIFIRKHLPLVAVRMQPLAILAHAARELSWSPGESVVRAGASDRDAFIVIAGSLAASRSSEETRMLGPGTAFGALEILAGRPNDHDVTAVTQTRALAISPSAIFDVLEDSAELGLAIASSLAATILDAAAHGTRATTAESNSCPVPSIACITSSSVPTSTST